MSVTLDDVLAARRRLASLVRRTPLAESAWLSDVGRGQVSLKLESLQLTNSFKTRGALNALKVLSERAGNSPVHVITASAGNHGRAMAYAAQQLGIRLTVFTSHDAPRTKLDAIRRHGADLDDTAHGYEDAEHRAKALAAAESATFISAYSHPDVIAGAGTIGLEILEDLPETEVVLVPVGGGGLLSGIAIAAKAVSPGVRVIGVEAEASPAFHTSLREGRITEIAVGPTIADGLAGNMDPDTITFDVIRRLVDRMLLVSEDSLRHGIRGLVSHEQLIAEGAGVVAVAAITGGVADVRSRRTVAVVSGSNIDSDRLIEILTEREGPPASEPVF